MLLETQRLTKWYGSVRAVDDVTFSIAGGEVLGYLGPNGSGKSTTVAMIVGLLDPTTGEIRFNGESIHKDLIEYRRHIGYVPEQPHLYPFLTGVEFLELVGQLRDLNTRVAARRIDALLELLGCAGLAHTPISAYSKGTRQKILLAGALLHDPQLLVLDEPASGLDATSALVVSELVEQLAHSGKAVLYCSHELASVERTCTRVLVLHKGAVIAHDTVDGLRASLAKPSLEEVFRQLVCEVDPTSTAREIVQAMRIS